MSGRRSGVRLAVGIGGTVLLARALGGRGGNPVVTYPPLEDGGAARLRAAFARLPGSSSASKRRA